MQTAGSHRTCGTTGTYDSLSRPEGPYLSLEQQLGPCHREILTSGRTRAGSGPGPPKRDPVSLVLCGLPTLVL